ncbi:hypothetical protein Tco_0771797 [Tanacetum coccineum]|uniref:Retrotransposon gag domain-containing protein n=1 Tax=Tanacetum coccineum TaxID=301880 RepID=A0ABQ4ZIN9_9ASTR
MVMEMGVEANLMAEVVAEGPCARLEGAHTRNSSTVNLLTSRCQVKYATCTLLNGALTWWNSHVRTVGHDAAYDMSWKDLMKMITEAYCLRNEIQKLETELWNLTIKGISDRIQGKVTSARTTRLQDTVKLANSLMDHKIHVFAARQVDNKRRMENNPRDNHV